MCAEYNHKVNVYGEVTCLHVGCCFTYVTLADFEYPVAAHWFIYLLWLKGFSIILLSNHFTMRVPC
jgi:hypothetical protein